MKTWQRYGIVLAFLLWAFGNIPAWLFLPVHHYSDGSSYSYAIWWSIGIVLLGAALVFCGALALVAPDFVSWLRGTEQREQEREARARRIDRLERELGIGPYRKDAA